MTELEFMPANGGRCSPIDDQWNESGPTTDVHEAARPTELRAFAKLKNMSAVSDVPEVNFGAIARITRDNSTAQRLAFRV